MYEGDADKMKKINFSERENLDRFLNLLCKIFMKLLETLLSVKVWTLFTIIFISTYLLTVDKIDADVWQTMMLSSAIPIIVMRETYKISKVIDWKKDKNIFKTDDESVIIPTTVEDKQEEI